MSLPSASAALEAFDELFLVVDDGRITEYNAAAESIAGGELDGRDFVDLFSETGADTAGRALGRAAGGTTVEAELAGGGVYEFEMTRLDDGRIAVLARDVGQRREQRRELEARERALKRMHGITADGDRSFEEQVRALLGLVRDELGLAAGSLSRTRDSGVDFEIIEGGGPIAERETIPMEETFCDLVVSDHETLVINGVGPDSPVAGRDTYTERGIACYLGAPVYVDDGMYGSICFYDTEARKTEFSPWDVTLVDLLSQWVSHELQRRRNREQLRRQNEKLDRFASVVSHDLRNPLNVLAGSLELAEETGDPEHFERAGSAVDRMEALIDDVLALARAGDAIDETERVALATVGEESWAGVETGRATLSVETDRTVVADPTRLRQLLENLFRNAVEHGATGSQPPADDAAEHGVEGRPDDGSGAAPTTNGGDGLSVTVGNVPEGDGVGGFFVADDGVGIDAEDRGDVFESGFSTATEGTGFGLAIVEEVAEAHGWTVELAESEAGGARFEFTGVDVVREGGSTN